MGPGVCYERKVDTKFLMVTGAQGRIGDLSESEVRDLGVVTPRGRAIVGINSGGPTRPWTFRGSCPGEVYHSVIKLQNTILKLYRKDVQGHVLGYL